MHIGAPQKGDISTPGPVQYKSILRLKFVHKPLRAFGAVEPTNCRITASANEMMLKLFIAVAAISAVGCDNIDKDAQITSLSNEVSHDGTYQFNFASSNGIAAQEAGVGGQYASGSAQWYSPEGTPIQLTYTADENGYQPQGDHLPTPPPIPDYVLKALEYIRTHPPKEENYDRKY